LHGIAVGLPLWTSAASTVVMPSLATYTHLPLAPPRSGSPTLVPVQCLQGEPSFNIFICLTICLSFKASLKKRKIEGREMKAGKIIQEHKVSPQGGNGATQADIKEWRLMCEQEYKIMFYGINTLESDVKACGDNEGLTCSSTDGDVQQ
jgi:hypothetical protein